MAVLASMAAGAACATLADEPCAGQARCGGAGEVNRAGSDLGVPAGTVKSVEGLAAIASAGTFACWCSAAQAYRPFDGTDAAVAETGEVEIELGPVRYLRSGADRTLFAPNVRINCGFTPSWEAVLEGILAHGLTADIPGTRLVESVAMLKTVLREGSLQEKSGPSIATEFGVLLPGINDEHGTGAVLN